MRLSISSKICCIGAFLLSFQAQGLAAADSGIAMLVQEHSPWIVREGPDGMERMIVLSLSNEGPAPIEGLELTIRWKDKVIRREILPVPPGGAWDTFWLPEPGPHTVKARLTQGGKKVWKGSIEIPEYSTKVVVIRRSDPVRLEDLKPLSLRGTNYLPRETPWPGLWREATSKTFDKEFDVMKDLSMNAFRTFIFFDEEAGLVRRDGTLTPALLAKVDVLLSQADRHGLKVMICPTGSLPHLNEIDTWRRFFRTCVEPFMYDGRVLMWDLINEPGGSEGPKSTPELSQWIPTLYQDLERLAPHHLLTVGLCWQFDQLWDLGVAPPVAQYHNYSGAVGVQPEGAPPVRNVAEDLRSILKSVDHRPLIIGEFGYATAPDEGRKDASEARQREIYEGVLQGAEAADIAGVFNWTLFHFVPDWMGPGEQSFGIVWPDGRLKPAGDLLKETFSRWSSVTRAPWEKE